MASRMFLTVAALAGVLAPTDAWAGNNAAGHAAELDFGASIGLALMIAVLVVAAHIARKTAWGEGGHKALTVLREFAVFLIFGSVAAQVWANVDYSSYELFIHAPLFYLPGVDGVVTPHFFINDGPLMTSFFGVAAAELTEARKSKNGGLYGSKIWLPLGACLGGVIMPIAVYLIFCTPEMQHGYPVSMATDIAFAWLGARILFGPKHPAVMFLLAFAVLDDFVGMGYIAVKMPQHPFNPIGIAALAFGISTAFSLRKMSDSSNAAARYLGNQWWAYVIGAGTFTWYGLYMAGLHPALALVFVVPFMPMAEEDDGLYAPDTEHHDHTPMGNFKHLLEAPIDVGLCMFGLMNAGVLWIGKDGAWTQNSTAVLLALMIGKTVGVLGFTWLTYQIIRLKNRAATLPSNEHGTMTWTVVALVGLLGGNGFTVALFMVDAGNLPDELRMGALASLVCLPIALIIGKLVLAKKGDKQQDLLDERAYASK